MDFFDNAMSKAKEAIDVACKKTNEVVNTQKQKIDVASLENKRSKDYECLGKIFFDKIKDESDNEESINNIVSAIKEKNQQIEKLMTDINSAKNKRICPKCGAAIENNSNYCNVCGAKLVYNSDEE